MGSLHSLALADGVTLSRAIDAYLATLSAPEHKNTYRAYARVLARLADEFGPASAPDAINADDFARWFDARWLGSSPSTYNVSLVAIRSAVAYWQRQGWITADPSRLMERRKQSPDLSRALTRAEVSRLLSDEKHGLRERTLWRMLYETAARSAEVLALDIEDLDLPNRRARVHRKGGAVEYIFWQTATARLLPRLLKGRTSGPVFLTERRARVQLAPADIDQESGKARLSYQQAYAIFKEASGGSSLHQLRHSALTHDAEDGTSTPMLMGRSGHKSVRSLARYARVSAEAVARHQAERDPERRR